jgi:hypothetical protein
MKNQKEFIGKKFNTPEGGVLTVIGLADKRGNVALFNLECSICSKDKELWPSGSIVTSKKILTVPHDSSSYFS